MSEGTGGGASATTSGLVAHTKEIVDKLKETPQFSENIKNTLEYLLDLADDLETLTNRSFTSDWEFNDFVLEFDWGDKAKIKAPRSRLIIGYINSQCLKSKPIYECLKEPFSNKQAMIEKVLKEFSEALNKYVSTLSEILIDEDP
jgi:hypothetical protein